MGHVEPSNETDSRRVYHRELDTAKRDSLSQIAARLAPSDTVLDVGTGAGALGRYLSSIGAIVDGVTYAPREVEYAKPYYREIKCADIEQNRLDELFAGKQYDAIVFADVLEHVREPAQTLEQAQNLLKPGGRILISIPNIGYIGVVANLMAGAFRYTDEGLLDRTHVRFFTRLSLLEMLSSVGLRATHVDAVVQTLDKSEFAHLNPHALAPAVQKALLSNEDALVYQFIVEAQRTNEVSLTTSMAALPRPELTFIAKTYWAGPEHPFSEETAVTCAAKIGEEHQLLRFDLPAATVISRLRFDPADRPGLMRLHRITWREASGRTRWDWSGQQDVLEPAQATFLTLGEHGWCIAMLDDDPSIEWSVGSIATSEGDYLECEVDWPSSPDVLALKVQFDDWLRRREAKLTERCAELAETLAKAGEEAHAAQRALEHRTTAHVMELRLISGLAVRLDAVARLHQADLATLNDALERERARNRDLADEVTGLQQQLVALSADLTARMDKVEDLRRLHDDTESGEATDKGGVRGVKHLRRMWRK